MPKGFDLNERAYRKNSFVFTDEELHALEDLKIELRRQLALPATLNDLVRIAVHRLIEDYRARGDASEAVRRLTRKAA